VTCTCCVPTIFRAATFLRQDSQVGSLLLSEIRSCCALLERSRDGGVPPESSPLVLPTSREGNRNVGLSTLIFTRTSSSNNLGSSLRLDQLFLRLGKEKKQPSFVHNHRELPFRHTSWPLRAQFNTWQAIFSLLSAQYRSPTTLNTFGL
jgi:hypothetical protein